MASRLQSRSIIAPLEVATQLSKSKMLQSIFGTFQFFVAPQIFADGVR